MLRAAWPQGAQGLIREPGGGHTCECSDSNPSLREAFGHSLGNGFFRASLMGEATLSQTPKAEKRLTQSKGQRPSLSKGAEGG